MFKQRPQSPEYGSEDPRITRLRKVERAFVFLKLAIEATPSREAFTMSAAPTAVETAPVFIEPAYAQPETQETLLEKARISTERAYGTHPKFSHRAEDMNEDYIDAQKMLHHKEGATIVPFPQQLLDNNTNVKRVA
jgi:hypothetical protein